MKVKFLKDYTTKEAKPKTWKKDHVEEFPDDETGRASAMHFINRGIAEEVAEPEARARARAPERMTPDVPDQGLHGKKTT